MKFERLRAVLRAVSGKFSGLTPTWLRRTSLRNLSWWVSHAWNLKIQLVIGLFALLIVAISLMGFWFYSSQLSGLSGEYFRVQAFGPQTVHGCSESELEQDFAQLPPLAVFHLETRNLHGNSVKDAEVQAELLTEPGKPPLWSTLSRTDAYGCLEMLIPQLAGLPDHVQLQVVAKHKGYSTSFTAKLHVLPRPETPSGSETLDTPPDWSGFAFHERRLMEEDFLPEAVKRAKAQGLPLHMTLPRRANFADRDVVVKMLDTPKPLPYFLAVWAGRELLLCRPVITGDSVKKVRLKLPEDRTGVIKVVLLDYGPSGPRVLQEELICRFGRDLPAQETFLAELDRLVEVRRTSLFRQTEHLVEFMPQEVANPEEDAEPWRIERDDRLEALEFLLASQIPAQDRAGVERLETLLDAVAATPQLFKLRGTRVLVERSLEFQSRCLNASRPSEITHRGRIEEFPIVYDNMADLYKRNDRKLDSIHNSLRAGMNMYVCQILSLSACLVLFLMLVALVGIPLNVRAWLFALGVLVMACVLSSIMTAQGNVLHHSENPMFSIFTGTTASPTTTVFPTSSPSAPPVN